MGIRDSAPTETEIHEVLRNERRRCVIEALRRRLGRASLGELADAVAEAETDAETSVATVRNSVYNSLRQTHLPRLDAAGVLHYDRTRQEVALRSDVRWLDQYMEVATGYGVTWTELYRTLSLVGFLAILATQLDVPVFESVGPLVVAVVFLVALVIATVSQLWTRRWRYARLVYDDQREHR